MTIGSNDQPSLGLTVQIAVTGIYPGSGEPGDGAESGYLAQIHLYAYSPSIDGNLANANGALLSINQNIALFSLMGTTYGGNGVTTFALPDLVGTIGVGAGSADPLGMVNGSDSIWINPASLPATSGGSGQTVSNVEPELAINYYIAITGIFPAGSPTLNTIGMVSQFAGTVVPGGYLPCDGRLLSIAQYGALFAVIGTTYGGDGQTTFALPNLQGRVPVGHDATHGVGQAFGSDQIVITQANMPVEMGGSAAPIDNHEASLAMRYLISPYGVFPGSNGGDPGQTMVGEMFLYAGGYLPDGYIEAAGQLLSIAEYETLFYLIGTTYGGDGETTFALPDMRGRAVTGADESATLLGGLYGSGSFTLTMADIGALTINGTEAADSRWGGNLADIINGWGGNDILVGNGGNDQIDGGTGTDQMRGGTGDDSYVVDNAGDKVFEANGEGYDRISSSVSYNLNGQFVEDLTLTGTANINATGNGLRNVLIGNSGNNVLNGGGNIDSMAGGLGDDIYYVDNGADDVIEANNAGYDIIYSSVSYNLNGRFVEELILTGSDPINAAGNSQANRLVGNSGANMLDGGGGADVMEGKEGDDIYIVDNAGDVVTERLNQGIDEVRTGLASYTLGANVENLTATSDVNHVFVGNALSNRLTGGAGNDALNGSGGADIMIGGAGNDTYFVDNVGDVVIELDNGGTDIVSSSVSFNLVGTFVENLILSGSANNYAVGNNLANSLTGNSGSNILRGGLGNDMLTGGAGQDYFAFDTALGPNNVDTITDFSVVDDTIRLSRATFTAIGPNGWLDADAFRIGTFATDAEDRIIYNSGTGKLYYDADGNGAGAQVQFAQLATGLGLTSGDFFIVA